jgi:hypothetical protein
MSDVGSYDVVVCVPGEAHWCVNREHELRQWLQTGGRSRFVTDSSLVPAVRTTLDDETTLLELRWKGLGGASPEQALATALEVVSSFPDLDGVGFSRLEVTRSSNCDRAGRWARTASIGGGRP